MQIPTTILPSQWNTDSYTKAMELLAFGKLYLNTALMILARVLCAVAFCSMAVYEDEEKLRKEETPWGEKQRQETDSRKGADLREKKVHDAEQGAYTLEIVLSDPAAGVEVLLRYGVPWNGIWNESR